MVSLDLLPDEDEESYYRRKSAETGIAADILKRQLKMPPCKKKPLEPQQYNLRKRKLPLHNCIWINKKFKRTCFRDRALHKVDVDTYHGNSTKDQFLKKILDLSKKSQRSQIDSFVHKSKPFIVMTWLSAARIFEYNSEKNDYFEVKRIPQRYISLSPNIITCVHHSDSKLYLGYLSSPFEQNTKDKLAYIEVRNLHGDLIQKPYYYDLIIKSIHSDQSFIYAQTVKNVVYIHRKDLFHFAFYRINMNQITQEPLVAIYAKVISSNPFTKLRLLLSTPNELLITYYDALNHVLWQRYEFCQSFKTISMFLHNDTVIIHRNIIESKQNGSQIRSRIEIGRIIKFKDAEIGGKYFVHERSLGFKHHIVQVELGPNNSLYLLGFSGFKGDEKFEVGNISLDDLRPLWVRRLRDVNTDTKILAQDDHVIVIQNCQHYLSIPRKQSFSDSKTCPDCKVEIPSKEFIEHELHPGILRDFQLLTNKFQLRELCKN